MEIYTEPVFKLPSQIANILYKLKLHKYLETGQYSKINKRIRITGRGILNQSSYHIKCYRKLGTSVSNL